MSRRLNMRAVIYLTVALLVGACTASRPGQEAVDAENTPAGRATSPSAQAARATPIRTQPRPGEVVFYRLHPDPDKVDRYCGAFDRSYMVEPVDIPESERDVLRRALEALFREEWDLPNVVGPVTITDGRAIVNLGSWEGLGFAARAAEAWVSWDRFCEPHSSRFHREGSA